jgi:hypothetical protein
MVTVLRSEQPDAQSLGIAIVAMNVLPLTGVTGLFGHECRGGCSMVHSAALAQPIVAIGHLPVR